MPTPEELFDNNRKLNEAETAERKTVLESKPRYLRIGLTRRCNLKCIMCGAWKSPFEMSERLVEEIEEVMPYIEKIKWTGGEVFLSPHFERMIKRGAMYKKLFQSIITNGLLIDDKWAEILVKLNVHVCYSIEGVRKESYESIKRGARYEDLLRSIRLLREAKEKRNNSFEYGMNVLIIRRNHLELLDALKFAVDQGFGYIHYRAVNYIRDKENIFYHNDREALKNIEKQFHEIRKEAERNRIKVIWRLPEEHHIPLYRKQTDHENQDYAKYLPANNNKLYCTLPWKSLSLGENGVSSECFCEHGDIDVNKSTLIQLWNSKIMQQLRYNMVHHRFDFCDYRCVTGILEEQYRH